MPVHDHHPHAVPTKVSQRPSKSCTECIRRKSRCNKIVPCDLCIKRGVTHLCRLESQFVLAGPPPPTSIPTGSSNNDDHVPGVNASLHDLESLRQSVTAELEQLRRRIHELENNAATVTATREGSTASRHPPAEADVETSDAATTLEFFALGVDRRKGPEHERLERAAGPPALSSMPAYGARDHIFSEPYERAMPEVVTDALLPLEHVEAILRFAEQSSWQHCCVFFPRLWDEVGAFYAAIAVGWNMVDPTWVALLYALQAITIHQMTDADALSCGLADGDKYVLPSALIEAAEAALYTGQFLSRPTMWTVQTCALLSVCGHNVCDSALLSSLLAIGIKTAQALNLHSLGKPARQLEVEVKIGPRPARPDLIRQVIDVEMAKRVWWALTQQDWFNIPYRGVWSVHPDQFDTPFPNNCHDEDLSEGMCLSRPESEATVVTKMCTTAQVATVLQSFFRHLNHHRANTPFSAAENAANQIQQLLRSLPTALQPDPPPDIVQPAWAPITRHYLHISTSHKSLIVYRAILSRASGTVGDRRRAHEACIVLSESILTEFERGKGLGDSGRILWTIPYHALAAAVVLTLGLVAQNGKPDAEKRLEKVMNCKASLERLSSTSPIARRGLQVLNDLLREVDGARARKRASGDDVSVTQVAKKVRLPDEPTSDDASKRSEGRSSHHIPTPQSVEHTGGHSGYGGEHSGHGPEAHSHGHGHGHGQHAWPSSAAEYPTLFDMAYDDSLLASLHNLPEISQLFDGSIGAFNWQM